MRNFMMGNSGLHNFGVTKLWLHKNVGTLCMNALVSGILWSISLCCIAADLDANNTSADPNSAVVLLARYASLSTQLRTNQFGRPLYLESAQSSKQLSGDIYAVLGYPFAVVGKTLSEPNQWCEVLMLHLNTKYCRAEPLVGKGGAMLTMMLGKKVEQPLRDAYRVDFSYGVVKNTRQYLNVRLHAKEGPLSTRDYRIELEAVPLPDGTTFMHLRYAYGFGFTGAMAMQVYLATVAGDKVGFTQVEKAYIGGMRGVIERNTMRYYLAIDAYLDALAVAPGAQIEKRLDSWFTATERYPRQLHEIERDAYLKMKRNEFRRLLTVP